MAKKFLLRDLIGKLARSRFEIQTKGGTIFPAGTIFIIHAHWRGLLDLNEWDGKTIPEVDKTHHNWRSRGGEVGRHRYVSKVHRSDLELVNTCLEDGCLKVEDIQTGGRIAPQPLPTPAREYNLRLSHPELIVLAARVARVIRAHESTKTEVDPAVVRVNRKLEQLVESAGA